MDELPSSIPICLPNGTTLHQSVVYESLPRFCKHCQVLGHSIGACTKSSTLVDPDKEGSEDMAAPLSGPPQVQRVTAFQRLGKTVHTHKGHAKGQTEAAHSNKGNDKGQTEVVHNNKENDKWKTVVEDTCLDPMHVEADEWEVVRWKHNKKIQTHKGNNVHFVELHAGISAEVSTKSGGRKHANKAQGSGRGPPATPAKG
jgi:hypothetical protein